jgi:hypothetical protein
MSNRFSDWLFGTLISVDVPHQELLRGFVVLLLIPFAVFLLSYVRVPFVLTKDRARSPKPVLPHRTLRKTNVSFQARSP